MTREHSRRQVLQGLGAAGLALVVGCGRLPGQGQPPPRVPRIGILQAETRPYASFLEGLLEFGYVEGQNVLIERRYGQESDDPLEEFIGELVRLPVDVLVVSSAAYATTAREASSTIPIVVAGQGNLLASGLAASLGRPGGTVTGLNSPPTLVGKRLELLKQTIPAVARVALLWGGATGPGNDYGPQDAVRALGIALDVVHVRGAHEIEGAFEAITQQGVDALLGGSHRVLLSSRQRILDLALQHRLPSMWDGGAWAVAGGLMGYGTDAMATWRRAAYYVDRILKGTYPGDIPIEQPREFEFVINLQTARGLGLTIPPHVLAQATGVIQ